MRVVVVTPPAPVVSLAEAKAHLRVDLDDDDALIEGMIAAATGHIDGPDGWLGRAIGEQVLEARLATWAIPENFELPYPPLIDVEQISYRDSARATIVVDADRYEVVDGLVEAVGDIAWIGVRPGANEMRVRYRAGYAILPPAIRAAILLMTEDLYRNRGEAVIGMTSAQIAMAPSVAALLGPFRVWR